MGKRLFIQKERSINSRSAVDGFVLWYKESYYEVRDIDPKKTVSFLEVIC